MRRRSKFEAAYKRHSESDRYRRCKKISLHPLSNLLLCIALIFMTRKKKHVKNNSIMKMSSYHNNDHPLLFITKFQPQHGLRTLSIHLIPHPPVNNDFWGGQTICSLSLLCLSLCCLPGLLCLFGLSPLL